VHKTILAWDAECGSVVPRRPSTTRMSPTLTIESELILACARTDPDAQRIGDLHGRGPDWRAVVRTAERWRVVPLLHASLRQVDRAGAVPNAVMERLRNLHHRDATYGIARRAMLRAVLERLAAAGVPVVVLGSAALAAVVYPSPSLRSSR